MNRRDAVAALLALGAAPLRSLAQPPGKVWRVGLLVVTSAADYAPQIEALRQGLRELGYVEGRNMVIDIRWAESRGERLPALAAELIRLGPDVLVTSGAGVRAAREATTTIPVVMAASGDAVASGHVASLAQPGGNITGSTFFGPEILAKRLEILKQAVPRMAKVAVLRGGAGRLHLELMQQAAAALKVEHFEVTARVPDEFEEAITQALRQRADGLLVPDDTMFVANMRGLGELATAKRLPGAGSAGFAEGGGLLAYGADFPALWRRAASFVDRILKGAAPASIPVERASRFSLVVNLKAAKALGLSVPQAVLVRADEVIR